MIKGYYVGYGYMGWIEEEHRYMLFLSEEEYLDYVSM